jgi:hypothetical protein
MGMSAQGSQGGVQNNEGNVFYDSETGQYYINQPAPVKEVRQNSIGMGMFGQAPDAVMGIFGQAPSKKGNGDRTYLPNYVSPASKPTMQHNYIDIAALFPELYQVAQGMQGDSQASAGLLGGQGAAQSASSGAGRFM